MNDIGKKLKKLREQNGLTRKDAVDRLSKIGIDISDKTLYGYESGRNSANADMFLALCQIYNCKNIANEFSGLSEEVLFTNAEWELIEKYRALDSHGHDIVETILDKEYLRCIELQRLKITPFVKDSIPDYLSANAAHDRTDTAFTEEDRKADEDMLD